MCRISKEDVAKLRESCHKSGGAIDTLETYNFKLTSKTRKLDIRLKFSEGEPKVVTVRKFEHKVAVFDILCLSKYVEKLHIACNLINGNTYIYTGDTT